MLSNQKTAAEIRRDYLREWRRKNPEKVKKYNQEYWNRKALSKEGGNNGGQNCKS